jgi:hypothetical protein
VKFWRLSLKASIRRPGEAWTDSGNAPYLRLRRPAPVLRKVEVSCVEETKPEGKLKKITEILSEAIYAYLKHKGAVRKPSPLRRKEN